MSDYIDQLRIKQYYQPPAGNTEKYIILKPVRVSDGLFSSNDSVGNYYIHDFGTGFGAAEKILQHILENKLHCKFIRKNDFWHKVLALKLECEIHSAF